LRGTRRRAARAQEIQNRLRRSRPGATAQVGVDTRELAFQGAAPFGIVKPHQELRSDRLRDNLVLKIFADDAPIRK
jgi:hypothetical protein